jgi:hypothetical protein
MSPPREGLPREGNPIICVNLTLALGSLMEIQEKADIGEIPPAIFEVNAQQEYLWHGGVDAHIRFFRFGGKII